MRGKKEGIATRDMLANPKGRGEDRTRKREGQEGDTFLVKCLAPLWGAERFFTKECITSFGLTKKTL